MNRLFVLRYCTIGFCDDEKKVIIGVTSETRIVETEACRMLCEQTVLCPQNSSDSILLNILEGGLALV